MAGGGHGWRGYGWRGHGWRGHGWRGHNSFVSHRLVLMNVLMMTTCKLQCVVKIPFLRTVSALERGICSTCTCG